VKKSLEQVAGSKEQKIKRGFEESKSRGKEKEHRRGRLSLPWKGRGINSLSL